MSMTVAQPGFIGGALEEVLSQVDPKTMEMPPKGSKGISGLIRQVMLKANEQNPGSFTFSQQQNQSPEEKIRGMVNTVGNRIFDRATPQQMQQPLTPQGGVASLGNRQDMADKLANMGQFDDDQIAHVAEGEVIVPAPIIKYYPEVRDQIFTLIRKEGLDPEEFIVGGDLVARNPNTGLMEFGWLSKTFKKIKKAFKKLAPVILAVALPGIGTALGASSLFGYATLGQAALTGAAAGGIGGLIQGKSFKDSLKMAAVSGLTAGVFKGVGNKFAGRGFFDSGVSASTAGAGSGAVGQTGTEAIKTLDTTGAFLKGPDGALSYVDDPRMLASSADAITKTSVVPSVGSLPSTPPSGPFGYVKTPIKSLKEAFLGAPGTQPSNLNLTEAVKASQGGGIPGFLKPQNPTDLVNLAGLTMVGGGLLAGEEEMPQGEEYVPYDPGEGEVFGGLMYDPKTGTFLAPQVVGTGRQPKFAAAGGAVSGPGTGTSDSIPAMLSDGEFVMTAKAVRGMGNGSRKKGAAEMYKMMNKLESMA